MSLLYRVGYFDLEPVPYFRKKNLKDYYFNIDLSHAFEMTRCGKPSLP